MSQSVKSKINQSGLKACCLSARKQGGFTLVEIMVAVAVLALLLAISAQVIAQAQRTWSRSTARLSQFREVRLAFDLMTKTLSQATIGSYWIDNRTSPLDVSTQFQRRSDLQFVTGDAAALVQNATGGPVIGHAVFFQAPLGVVEDQENAGLANLLCSRGYFVQYASDEAFRPGFLADLKPRTRYRLMEFSPYAETNVIFSDPNRWFEDAGGAVSSNGATDKGGDTRPIADNIVMLVISPGYQTGISGNDFDTSLANTYDYDSTKVDNQSLAGELSGVTTAQGTQHMLPPALKVVLVAIDESSAQRMESEGNASFMNDSGVTFANAGKLADDLAKLEEFLVEKKLNYRVFSTTIALHD
jgi:uncharacterized protein (TIGR02599 family)